MLYLFNGKRCKDGLSLAKEIKSHISVTLKQYNLIVNENTITLDNLHDSFVVGLLTPSQSPNPIKHPNETSNLVFKFNRQNFKNCYIPLNCFSITEQISVTCYCNQNTNKITIEVKHMLIKVVLSTNELIVILNEI